MAEVYCLDCDCEVTDVVHCDGCDEVLCQHCGKRCLKCQNKPVRAHDAAWEANCPVSGASREKSRVSEAR